jgi:hypothetical protein
MDVIRNLIGTCVAISFLIPAYKAIQKPHLRILQVLTFSIVLIAIFPFVKSAADEWLAWKQFPVLSDFETPFEIDRWAGNAKLSISNAVHSHGRSALKLALNTSNYSGASLRYFPGNWQNYQYLQLNIFNPQEESLKITCRIHDRRHTEGNQAYDDRFNKNYLLLRGWNRIEIPLEQVANAPKERKLDLGTIQELGIFAHRLPCSRVIYVENVSLARIQILSRPQVR